MTTVPQGLGNPLLVIAAMSVDALPPFKPDVTSVGSGSTTLLIMVALIAIVIATVMYLREMHLFWMPAAVLVVTSQVVIISHWEQAKYATVVNFVIIIAVAMSAAAMRFRAVAQQQADMLFATRSNQIVVTDEMISPLPQAVQRWILRAGIVGKETPGKLIIAQRGMLRTKPEQRWMPFEATQYFSIDPPGFVWTAAITAAPGITIAGRDIYRGGRGQMVIKPLYLFEAANGSGKEIDQGTLVRYLAEMAWFPQSALSPYLRWQRINDNSAQVTMEYGGISASAIYAFTPDGDVAGFEAKRYGNFGDVYKKETWLVKTTGYATFNGVRIGHKSDVIWKLAEGDFHWLTVEVTAITPAT